MLETRFKVAFLLVVIAFAALPIIGILRGTRLTPFEEAPPATVESPPSEPEATSNEEPVKEDMVRGSGASASHEVSKWRESQKPLVSWQFFC